MPTISNCCPEWWARRACHRAARSRGPVGFAHTANSSLWSVLGPALAATVAVNADRGEPVDMRGPFPDEAREIFQCRRPERLDPVEQLVVERLLNLGNAPLQKAKVHHHAAFGIRHATH